MNNITTQDFGDFRFYDAMLTIDNEKFMQKLQKTSTEIPKVVVSEIGEAC